MAGDAEIQAALLTAQQAALRACDWVDALEQVSALFGSRLAALMALNPADGRNLVSAFCNLHPDSVTAYENRDFEDVWAGAEEAQGYLGRRVARGSWTYSKAQIKSTDFWRKCLHHDRLIDVLAIPVARSERAIGYLSVYADEDHGPFTDEDVALGRRLQPSLSASVAAYVEILRRGRAVSSLASGLARTGHAAIVLDADRRIIFRCGRAGDMIAAGQFFAVDRERLRGLREDIDDWLNEAFRAAAAAANGRDEGPLRRVFDLGGDEYAFEAQALGDRLAAAELGQAENAVLILARPCRDWEALDISAGARSLGLTPVEACIARDLLQGRTARQIASERRIGEATVRWHIKNVLGKAGCRRQLDFVSRMHRTAFPDPPPTCATPYF